MRAQLFELHQELNANDTNNANNANNASSDTNNANNASSANNANDTNDTNDTNNANNASSDIILLHCDMFPYTGNNIINLHIQEQTMVNVAAGIAYTGKPVIIYGVLGFVFLKALEQIKFSILDFAAKYAPIIMCNAGYTGCYEMFGKGHTFKEELDLCRIYNIDFFVPNKENFKDLIKDCLKTNGFKYILIY